MNDCRTTFDNTLGRLLDARGADGLWPGRLSSSPLATAVSITALHIADPPRYARSIQNGINWLADHQNPDGGWGDTENRDPSNLSTTLLSLAALCAVDKTGQFSTQVQNARTWLKRELHYTHEADLAEAVYAAYGDDRTFAVPILTHCVLAGLFQDTPHPWRFVKPLPFELARLPRALYRAVNLTVVSYALPALIAVGQARFHFDPPKNAFLRAIRRAACGPTLELLKSLQPTNGGFLEAPPLTAFVAMSLASIGQVQHPVAQKALAFLIAVQRSDGSWPIDTTLSTWLTTHAVKILGKEHLTESDRRNLADALVQQQYQNVHPFTGAAPGGWGWSHLPGAVPDADDTAGALVALYQLDNQSNAARQAAAAGVTWLLNLQNSDGGVPTFCRGWGKLEFDRSCADLTAHALDAFRLWRDRLPPALQSRIDLAIAGALRFLYAHQRQDGAWLPLWFGNPYAEDKTNPVYGTARVLTVLSKMNRCAYPILDAMIPPAVDYLSRSQQPDGGWESIEQTALAITALISAKQTQSDAIDAGLKWLTEHTDQGKALTPAPIGLYFAKLWYTEDLYPVLFTLEALHAVHRLSHTH
ncbi:MAG TPA: squalene--hopene cyclase [Phycisphaerales bacterium]|nr:squalene--hopene cyclase [Phycisphaerales bacterium]